MEKKNKAFRTEFSESIFNFKYKHEGAETWEELSKTLIEDVCRNYLSQEEKDELIEMHANMEFIAGGRYLYYAGRLNKFFNNCYLLRSLEDSREDWADLSWKAESCLMTGGGIGNDYSVYRYKGAPIKRTGGQASGPISKMKMINEIGREVMQGGSRRSAIYASLNWKHEDAGEFLHCKDWSSIPVAGAFDENGKQITVADLKEKDFNYPAPLDMTNISLNYDNEFLEELYGISFTRLQEIYKEGGKKAVFELPIVKIPLTFLENCRQALKTGEPGFSFNFFEKVFETLRNACVTGDTELLTKEGYKRIDSLINQEVEIWNGFEWSLVTPKVTGNNQHIIKITLSDGRELNSTDYHKWYLTEGYTGKSKQVTTNDLKIGDKIIKYNFPIIKEGKQVSLKHAYTQGFISAEGMDDYNHFWLYEPKYMCKDRLDIKLEGSEYSNVNGIKRKPIYYNDVYNEKSYVPFEWCLTSKVEWLSGLFDGDGTELIEGGLQLCSTDFNFLKDLQKLLSTLGVNSKVVHAQEEGNRLMPDGKGGEKEYFCQKSWRICIGAVQMQELKKLGLQCERMSFDKTPQRDASQFVKVVKIEDGGYVDNVYCFNEPLRHYGIFNGILTGQCTEVTSEDDSDVCNLASVNMSRITDIDRMTRVCYLVSKFLLCGTMVAELPYQKVYDVRIKNRRLGLGLMGVHEWLLQRGSRYEVTPELHEWLKVYAEQSEIGANELADKLQINKPVAYRAIAPTGTIGIMAGTTTGIEPLFAVAYKRRYLKGQKEWHYQYVIDGTAKLLIKEYGIDPYKIETALSLANDYERRIKFQADVQDYVDMSISSTINIPSWGTPINNDTKVNDFAKILGKYAIRLRGFTCYPDGSRGGQPLTIVDYYEAKNQEGQEFKEEFFDICEIGKNGTCGS